MSFIDLTVDERIQEEQDRQFLNGLAAPPARFIKRSKDFGLTYPEMLDIPKEELYQWLTRGLEVRRCKPEKVLLGEEIGKNSGRRHCHVYISFPRKVTVNERTFDYKNLHCHIADVKRSGMRGLKPMLEYVTKEDESPLANFNWEEMLLGKKTVATSPPWKEWVDEGLTQEQVNQRLLESEWCSKYFDKYFNWSAAIKKFFPAEKPAAYQPDPEHHFFPPADLCMWKEFYLDGWDGKSRPRSLVLIGPSRTGKTCWARSLRSNHMYFNNLLNLDDWDENADLIILDDFSPEFTKYLPAWKCFFGGQKEFTLTDKYRGKKTVHWGKPMIWLANEDFRSHLNAEQLDFIEKNCYFCKIVQKMY